MGKINKVKTITVKSIGFILASGLNGAIYRHLLNETDSDSETRPPLVRGRSNSDSSAPDAKRGRETTDMEIDGLAAAFQETSFFCLEELCKSLDAKDPHEVKESVLALLRSVSTFTEIDDSEISSLITMHGMSLNLQGQGTDVFHMQDHRVVCREKGRCAFIMTNPCGFFLLTNLDPIRAAAVLLKLSALDTSIELKEELNSGRTMRSSTSTVEYRGLHGKMYLFDVRLVRKVKPSRPTVCVCK